MSMPISLLFVAISTFSRVQLASALPLSTHRNRRRLSVGSIVGIAIGGFIALLILAVLCCCMRRRRSSRAGVTGRGGGVLGTQPSVPPGPRPSAGYPLQGAEQAPIPYGKEGAVPPPTGVHHQQAMDGGYAAPPGPPPEAHTQPHTEKNNFVGGFRHDV